LFQNPNDHHNEIKPVPRVTQVGIPVKDEAHSNDFEEAFNDEDVSENSTPPLDRLIFLLNVQVLRVNPETVVSTSHEE
jgi:hypothetical protein